MQHPTSTAENHGMRIETKIVPRKKRKGYGYHTHHLVSHNCHAHLYLHKIY